MRRIRFTGFQIDKRQKPVKGIKAVADIWRKHRV